MGRLYPAEYKLASPGSSTEERIAAALEVLAERAERMEGLMEVITTAIGTISRHS